MDSRTFELSDRDCMAADAAAEPARAPLDALLTQLRAEHPDLAEWLDDLDEAITGYACTLADAHASAALRANLVAAGRAR